MAPRQVKFRLPRFTRDYTIPVQSLFAERISENEDPNEMTSNSVNETENDEEDSEEENNEDGNETIAEISKNDPPQGASSKNKKLWPSLIQIRRWKRAAKNVTIE